LKSGSGFSRQSQLLDKWIRIVQSQGNISRNKLINMMRITVAQYNQLKSFVEEMAEELITYNKDTKCWESNKVPTQEIKN